MRQALFITLLTVNLLSLLHIGFYLVGANIYDILKLKKDHDKLKKTASSKYYKPTKLDLVSIVVPAYNESVGIKRTLDSIMTSTYKNIEIIIVNDGSIDKTSEVVQRYIKRIKRNKKLRVATYLPKDGRAIKSKRRYIRVHLNNYCRIKLVNQKNQGKAEAMNNAIRNHVRGRYVMCLDADSILHPTAVEKVVAYFKDNKVIGVAANVRIVQNKTLLGQLQRFEHLIGYRSKKFYNLINGEFIIGGVASTYRKTALKRVNLYDTDTMTEDIGLSLKMISVHGNKERRIIYASDVIAMTEGVQNFHDLLKQRFRWKMGNLQNIFKFKHLIAAYKPSRYSRALTFYRMPVALLSEVLLLLEPILIGYIIYISIVYQTYGVILGAYMFITMYTLCVLWPDEHLGFKDKLAMSFSALIMYAMFYVMDVVQLSAIFKTTFKYRQVFRLDNNIGTWISPKRATRATS